METVCIPADLSAFSLSPGYCQDKDGVPRLAPITQPNYIGLQLDNSLIQHDLLDHVDFHLTAPAERNPRISDLGKNPPTLRKNRLGVYLHWSLPRLYRSAYSEAQGYKKDANPQPQFRRVPNRWLIVRRLDVNTAEPKNALPEYQSWIVESDVVRRIGDIDDSADLEVDMVPFVSDQLSGGVSLDKPATGAAADPLQQQGEVFLGRRSKHVDWTPGKSPSPSAWVDNAKLQKTALTVMNSSNPLFPDYVPHNSNVFSIIDSFTYKEATEDEDRQCLTKASASYFVLGWHTTDANSPLWADDKSTKPLGDRLQDLFLKLAAGSTDDAAQTMLSKAGSCGVIVHGSIYNVSYDINKKAAGQADHAASLFSDKTKMEPVSMGTTPLDGILTFLQAHNSAHMVSEKDVFGDDVNVQNIIDDVVDLSALLYAADDSYNARVKAQDQAFQNNYASSDGGTEWHFNGLSPAGKPPLLPTRDEQVTLNQLNEAQATLDAATQKLRNVQWELFAEWWKYVSSRRKNDPNLINQCKVKVKELKETILTGRDVTGLGRTSGLQSVIRDCKKTIDGLKAKVLCKQSSKPPYFMRKDPTLCIAGLESGWPADYMETLTARAEHQVQPSQASMASASAFLGPTSNTIFTKSVTSAGLKLLAEFLSHVTSKDTTATKGHQQWKENPFQPLFIEWEAQYFHIDRDEWQVSLRKYPVGQPHAELRYGLNKRLDKSAQQDSRMISGRVVLTPQPVFSLEAAVKQVLDSAGPALPLSQDEKDRMVNDQSPLKKLKFISAPLSGLTEHLLTRYDGAHVKPSFRQQGRSTNPMNVAVNASAAIEVDVSRKKDDGTTDRPSMVELIGSESALTPYGDLINFGSSSHVPFKGVTHGQMLFTKLNIIDRFGQAVCAIPPKPKPRSAQQPPPSFYPCLSDYLSPDFLRDAKDPAKLSNTLNTVYQEPDNQAGEWPLCRFTQLTPSINQNARMNASFLNPGPGWSGGSASWHETCDDQHESPVFGWLVLNYQDCGLQFFLPDGTFYREVRVGGPSGINASSKWLPFDPPKPGISTGSPQLDQLIARMTTYTNPKDAKDTSARYLQGLLDMINGAIQNMPYPPSDYSAYANSIVGKPLALVNVGWSIELQAPPIKQQSTLSARLPGNSNDPIMYPEAADLLSYKFPIKLGDVERPFDGVVGYFQHSSSKTSQLTTNWEKLYTYFPSSGNPNTVNLTADQFPPLSVNYTHPDMLAAQKTTMEQARLRNYLVTTMLIDPYTPIHAYSPILPIKSLRLQPWTIQQAFSRMTAFFRLGPQLLSKDVPRFADGNLPALDPDTWQQKPTSPVKDDVGKAAPIRLPISGKKGLWKWLQPYDVEGEGDAAERKTKFVSFDVGEEDTRIRKDPAPYTFVEGYLQLARPLLKSDL